MIRYEILLRSENMEVNLYYERDFIQPDELEKINAVISDIKDILNIRESDNDNRN